MHGLAYVIQAGGGVIRYLHRYPLVGQDGRGRVHPDEVCASYSGGDIFGDLHNIHRSNTQGSGGRWIQNKYGDGIRVLPALVFYMWVS